MKVAKKTVQVKSTVLNYDFPVVRDFEKIMNEVADSTPRGVYRNEERLWYERLPIHDEDINYYTEWTVQTPEYINLWVWPERIVTGKWWEIWYTWDHYKNFTNLFQ